MMDWGTRAGTLEGALANIINECKLPSAQQMPQTALASIAAYARDVLERTAPRSRFVPGYDAITPAAIPSAPVAAGYAPTGTGWPVT